MRALELNWRENSPLPIISSIDVDIKRTSETAKAGSTRTEENAFNSIIRGGGVRPVVGMQRWMHNFEPYVSRPIKFIDQVNSEGWRIKVYGIAPKSKPLPTEVVTEGMVNVLSHLPQPYVTEQRYGVGFLIIHHKLFSSPLDKPSAISREPDRSLIACVHELRVIAFESEAWISTVLCQNDAPSFDNYLMLRME